MTAIGRLWFKWVSDDSKPYALDDVPSLWRAEVKELIEKEKKEREENDEIDGGVDRDY